jgi:3-oxoacid CoA-transferase subunit A
MELAFKADFAIVKAWKDAGNLILKELQETLIHVRAATITVAEVEELVEAGTLDLIKFIFLEYSCNVFSRIKI